MREQLRRLRKVEEIERRRATQSQDHFDRASRNTQYMIKDNGTFTEVRGGYCFNIAQLFRYRPATQQQLRAFLFSDSDRLSTFLARELPGNSVSGTISRGESRNQASVRRTSKSTASRREAARVEAPKSSEELIVRDPKLF